jgi:hypothetical protein
MILSSLSGSSMATVDPHLAISACFFLFQLPLPATEDCIDPLRHLEDAVSQFPIPLISEVDRVCPHGPLPGLKAAVLVESQEGAAVHLFVVATRHSWQESLMALRISLRPPKILDRNPSSLLFVQCPLSWQQAWQMCLGKGSRITFLFFFNRQRIGRELAIDMVLAIILLLRQVSSSGLVFHEIQAVVHHPQNDDPVLVHSCVLISRIRNPHPPYKKISSCQNDKEQTF